MKVFQIIPDLGLAGAEIMCENLAYTLKKNDVDMVVVSLYNYHSAITDRLKSAGIRVEFLSKKRGLDFHIFWRLLKLFKNEKPDVVHTHRYAIEYAIPAAIISRVPIKVHTVHNVARKENNRLVRFLAKVFYKFFNLTPVALSERIKKTILDEYNLMPEQVPVIFNGIDLSKCIPKQNYKIEERMNILHIGRFSQQKNHSGLLKAFKRFHDIYPNCILKLIGEGEKKKEIEQYISENDLSSCVEILGLQPQVYSYLSNADIFVLPSKYEGIPLSLIEAMGTGLPIIATNVGGVSDMLENNESAILINVNEIELTSALQTLYENESLRVKIGNKAKEDSIKFSAKNMGLEYLNLYKKIMKQRKYNE